MTCSRESRNTSTALQQWSYPHITRFEQSFCPLSGLIELTTTVISSQPAYIRFLHSEHIPAYSIRSSNTSLLLVPQVCTTFASQFQHCCPSVWSSLRSSTCIRTCSSSHTFYCHLKTLFLAGIITCYFLRVVLIGIIIIIRQFLRCCNISIK